MKWAESKILAENILGGDLRYNFGQTSYVTKDILNKWHQKGKTPNWIKKSKFLEVPEDFAHQFFKET